MAISGGDGSIILTTQVDQTGLKKGLSSMLGATRTTSNAFQKLSGYITTAFGITALMRFSKESSRFATQQEANIHRLVDIYGEANQVVTEFIDTNSRALGLSKSASASISATYGNLLSVWADQKTNAELTNALLNQTAVVASKTGRTTEDVAERIRSGLLGNTEAIEDLGINVNIKTIEITNAFKRIADGRSWEQLNAYEQSQVRTLAILEQSTNKYGTEVAKTSAFAKQQFQAAYDDFKASWGRVVNAILLPILEVATQILNTLTDVVNTMFGLEDTISKQTENIDGSVDSQKDLTTEVKKTAKEQKKLLAGFDELNVIAKEISSNNLDEVSGVGNIGFETGISGSKLKRKSNKQLAKIGMLAGYALVGLGILLTLTGHPFLGIGMVASGAVALFVSAKETSGLGEKEKNKLGKIGAVVGLVLMGLGILLLFTKFWKLGLGMVGAGATGLYALEKMGAFPVDMKKKLSEILEVAGFVLLLLGIFLLFLAKRFSIGLTMIGLGAASIYESSQLSGEELEKTIKRLIRENRDLIIGVGAIMVIIGVLLIFTKTHLLTGIAVLAGAAGLIWGADKMSDGSLRKEIKKFMDENCGWLEGLATAMFVLGTVLLFVPGMWGLGLALLGLGAGLGALTTAEIDATDNALKDMLAKKLDETYDMSVEKVDKINDKLSAIGRDLESDYPTQEELDIILGKKDVYKVKAGLKKKVVKTTPRLATGTVVPPNKEFLAVLGDNKKETEIVSPLSTMKQAFIEALGTVNLNNQDNRPIIIQVDSKEIARATRQGESKLGNQTVFGGFANAY